MSPAAPSSSPMRDLERLVEDVFRLRRVMAQNEHDKRLAANCEFRFLVDTPVVRLFAEPGRYADMVTAIPSLAGRADGDPDEGKGEPDRSESSPYRDAKYANALLTGEYIFKLGGPDGEDPVMISPEHAGEVYAYISHLEARSQSLFRLAKDADPAVFRDLRLLLLAKAESDERARGSEWLSSVRQPLIRTISEAAQSPLLAPSRLSSLFRREGLVNAARALAFDDGTVSPDYDLVADWARRIRLVKGRNERTPSAGAVDADAITLAQLELLNRDWRRTRRVYVLITNDRGLHRASSLRKRQLEEASPGVDVFYPVRDPRQYVPLLNVMAMGGALSDERVFKKVADSTRLFVSSFASTDGRLDVDFDRDPSNMPGGRAIRNVLENDAAQHSGGLDGYGGIVREQLEGIARSWLEAVEAALVAKTDVIAELDKRELGLWRNAVMHNAMRQDLRTQVSDLEASFEDLASTNTLLRQEIWATGQGLTQHLERPFRNQRRLASEFGSFRHPAFRGESLEHLLHRFRRHDSALVDEMRVMARGGEARAERLFISGCLSLEIGAWTGAEALLQRARRMRPAEPLASEVTFFLCVARRLSASADTFQRDYRTARSDLAILKAERDKTFDRVRIRSEILALELSEVAFRRAAKQRVAEQVRGCLDCWGDLGSYTERLLEPTSDDVWRVVSKQYILNTFNLAYWHYASGLDVPRKLVSVCERAFESLAGPALEYACDTVHGTIYPLLARYALDPSSREALTERIENAIATATEWDRAAGIAFDLPYVDKAEFRTIRQVIRVGPDE